MADEVVVRVAQPEDAQELARLNAAFNGVYESPEVIKSRLVHPARVETPLIALVGARAVGFAALRLVPCLFYSTAHAELTELYIDPGWRRQGIGRRLIALAEELALVGGAADLIILTGDDNVPAQALYRSLGYEDLDIALTKPLRRERNGI
jgi:ribosomal protein S18 acetylase RimI-like enzyme